MIDRLDFTQLNLVQCLTSLEIANLKKMYSSIYDDYIKKYNELLSNTDNSVLKSYVWNAEERLNFINQRVSVISQSNSCSHVSDEVRTLNYLVLRFLQDSQRNNNSEPMLASKQADIQLKVS